MSASMVTGMLLRERAGDPPVVFGADGDRRQRGGGVGRPVAADGVDAVSARRRRERPEDAFGLEERVARGHRPHAAAAAGRLPGRTATAAGASARRRQAELRLRRGPRLERVELLLGEAGRRSCPVGRHVGRRLCQHPLALQLALVGGQLLLGRRGHEHDLAAREAVGARRPRGRSARDRELLRRHRGEVELVIRPSPLEPVTVPPGFDLHVDQPVLLEFCDRPLRRLLRHRRPGEPRRVHVGEPAREVHDLRPLQALGLDLVDVDVVDRLAPGPQARDGQDGCGGERAKQAGQHMPSSHAVISSRHACGRIGEPVVSSTREAELQATTAQRQAFRTPGTRAGVSRVGGRRRHRAESGKRANRHAACRRHLHDPRLPAADRGPPP